MNTTATAQTLQQNEPEIERSETGIRLAITILFVIITEIVSTIVGAVVAFGLIWSFVTKRAPSRGLRDAANKLVAYQYRVGRWLTWNDHRMPFPFEEFPEPLEDPDWDPELKEFEEFTSLRGDRDEE